MQTDEKRKLFSGFTGTCTREEIKQRLFTSRGKTKESKSRSFQGLAEVYAPVKTSSLLYIRGAWSSLPAAPFVRKNMLMTVSRLELAQTTRVEGDLEKARGGG